MATTQVDRLDGVIGGAAFLKPALVATTANITLSGVQTIDGVAVVANDRVLVKDQTDTTENGLYDVAAGAWSRSRDFDGARDVTLGTMIAVGSGTTNADRVWRLTTSGEITYGTTAIAFEIAINQLNGVTSFMETVLGAVNAAAALALLGAGTGDASGPASSTDNAWPRFNGTGGKTLQNGKWVEADTTGKVTAGGDLDMADKVLSQASIKDTAYGLNALGDLGGGTDDIDYTAGHVVTATISTGTQTFTTSNWPAGYGALIIFLTNGGSQTINWPSGTSAAPTGLTASGVDKILMESPDDGTTYYITVLGRDI